MALPALLAFPLLTAAPASAATPGVTLSSDGVNFSSTFDGTLFESTALMVPMDSQAGRFWVKNASGESAFLRISVGQVTGGGSAFSSALTVTAGTPSQNGSHVAVDDADPCYVLTEGQRLAPGAVVRVDAALELGDLGGTDGQGQDVGFDILVGLSSTATGLMPATDCLTDSGTVPGTQGDGGHTGSGPSGGTSTVVGRNGIGPAPEGTSVGIVLPTLGGGAYAGEGRAIVILDANTGRFYQEWWVVLWVLAVIAGGVLCALVARRRFTEEEEVTRWGDVPLSGRKAWSTT